MPGVKLYTGNRLEILAGKLADTFRAPLPSALQEEIVLVQSRGMQRWISMELASILGVCCNVRFPFPNHFIREVFAKVMPAFSEKTLSDPGAMAWRIMGLLPSLLHLCAFAEVRDYLCGDESLLKRYQFAERMAHVFDQYLIYRPKMILQWDRGKADDWQAILWRSLSQEDGYVHRASLYQSFIDEISRGTGNRAGLPGRIAVFGISSLPPFHLKVLSALAGIVEINLFLMNPCREYWGDIVSGKEIRRIAGRWGKDGKTDGLHLEKGNSLLASMGLLGRDFFAFVYGLECEESDCFFDPQGEDLLSSIQSDILNLRERGKALVAKKTIAPGDRSVQIHACHSPLREVEVLQDVLLEMLDRDAGLRPRDILVMTPDIEAYAPLIQAVFSLPLEDPRWIPFSIADRGIRGESAPVESFLNLIDLYGSRFGAPQVLGVLESRAVRSKFSLSEEELEMIQRWMRDTGIRWGIDAQGRESFGLPAFAENTWRVGIDRALLGYALCAPGTGSGGIFAGTLPYMGIAESELPVLGRFLDFTGRLFASISSLSENRTLREWSKVLKTIAEDFLGWDHETQQDAILLIESLNALSDRQDASRFDEKIPFSVVRYCIRSLFEGHDLGAGFLSGGITFCAMLPMRSIPFKVICLIGVNDEDYPRRDHAFSFDLIAKNPKPGDRSRRSDDRYLFLEALLSARNRLHISYVGQDVRDNTIRPPCVLISELLDYIGQGFETSQDILPDALVTRHRLQAFHPDYFSRAEAEITRKFSYSTENCEAANLIGNTSAVPHPFICSALPEPGEQWRMLDVEDLCRFFAHPARYFLARRLGVFPGGSDGIAGETEPFSLKGLEKYRVERFLLEKRLAGESLDELYPVLKASGLLPPGVPGEFTYGKTAAAVESFFNRICDARGQGAPQTADVDLQIGGFRLTGRIPNVFQGGLLHFRYAKAKTADRMRAWILHLVLGQLWSGKAPPRSTVICEDIECSYAPLDPEKAGQKHLESLLEAYWLGLSRPLLFFPAASWTYAQSRRKGKTPGEALAAAARDWYGSDERPGEGADPYFTICFRETDPFRTDVNLRDQDTSGREAFRRLATDILDPLLGCIAGGV